MLKSRALEPHGWNRISAELLFLVNRLKPHTNDVGLLGTRPRKILASSREYELIMISTRFKAGL